MACRERSTLKGSQHSTGTPPGCDIRSIQTGGIASLNPRLMSRTPVGVLCGSKPEQGPDTKSGTEQSRFDQPRRDLQRREAFEEAHCGLGRRADARIAEAAAVLAFQNAIDVERKQTFALRDLVDRGG